MFKKKHNLPICAELAGYAFLLLLPIGGCVRGDGGQGEVENSRRLVESDSAAIDPVDNFSVTSRFSIRQDDFALGQDAVRLLTDAESEAITTHRNVMLQFSGPRCPPCRAMSLALATVKRLIEKDFVFVEIDRRMHNFDKVYSAYSRDVGSVPYLCFLSPTGSILAEGKNNGENIGFPLTPSTIVRFREMLDTTSSRLSAEELEQIV
ncbi:thioredoxin domain-containing protein [Rubripirellula lacrimiformis]|nr:hypothetical protein [Rubripirellula lacrimiformis]